MRRMVAVATIKIRPDRAGRLQRFVAFMKQSLSDCRLYGILDLSYVDSLAMPGVAAAMIQGGVDIIQLRGKEKTIDELTNIADALHDITYRSSIPLIVNDHAEIAKKVPVQGVHVGQNDDPISLVRKNVERNLWVGKSTHSLDQAVSAQAEGADYIGFGPIFATPTKPDYPPIGLGDIDRVHRAVRLPIFCIGGITMENLEQVIAAGARRVVIVSALLKAPNIAEYARSARKLLISDL
jgi:thiamine-phosphate pyrophosphorylase